MLELLEGVKKYSEFLTVDELDEALREIGGKDVMKIGKSEDGHEILGVKIGSGKERALVFGAPHPNEPIGCLACLELIKMIQKTEELKKKFTWFIIPCGDPDGVKLNEGWFKGKFSPKKYVYNFYRTPGHLQTEWSFPVKYKGFVFSKVPSNTMALKKLIDREKPVLDYPMHNASLSGAFFLITKDMPEEFYDKVIKMCDDLGIPLDMGEQAPFWKTLRKPFFLVPLFKDHYDFLEKFGKDPKKLMKHGMASIDYTLTKRKDALGLVGEIPYFFDKKIADDSLTKLTRREINREKYEGSLKVLRFVERNLSLPGLNKKSAFYVKLKSITEDFEAMFEAYFKNFKNKEYKKKATVAEVYEATVVGKYYDSLYLGELRRLLLESKETKEIKKLVKETESWIEKLLDEVDKKSDFVVIPIHKLIQLQIGFLFYSLGYMK